MRLISKDSPCFIIAEAGVNHNGDIEIAKQLIDVAVEAGVDAVKFQTFKADSLVTRNAKKANYQVENTQSSESQYEMLKKLELSYKAHKILIDYCSKKGIMFISTPFDFESVDFLCDLNIPMFKVSSGDLTNLPFLKYISSKGKPVIVSTGMATLGEIDEALEAIYSEGNGNVSILHCTTSYPTPYNEVNINAIKTLKDVFKIEVGYSDHTVGIEVPIAAVATGAKIIEKHFTLSKAMEGPDHKASLEPGELKAMVIAIRNIEIAMGDGIKKPTPEEMKNRDVVRKSIVACRDIKKGEKISSEMLALKRPGTGLAPKYLYSVIDRVATRDIPEGFPVQFGDFS